MEKFLWLELRAKWHEKVQDNPRKKFQSAGDLGQSAHRVPQNQKCVRIPQTKKRPQSHLMLMKFTIQEDWVKVSEFRCADRVQTCCRRPATVQYVEKSRMEDIYIKHCIASRSTTVMFFTMHSFLMSGHFVNWYFLHNFWF